MEGKNSSGKQLCQIVKEGNLSQQPWDDRGLSLLAWGRAGESLAESQEARRPCVGTAPTWMLHSSQVANGTCPLVHRNISHTTNRYTPSTCKLACGEYMLSCNCIRMQCMVNNILHYTPTTSKRTLTKKYRERCCNLVYLPVIFNHWLSPSK